MTKFAIFRRFPVNFSINKAHSKALLNNKKTLKDIKKEEENKARASIK